MKTKVLKFLLVSIVALLFILIVSFVMTVLIQAMFFALCAVRRLLRVMIMGVAGFVFD